MKTAEDQRRIHAARVKRAKKADKPHASNYSLANVHGDMRFNEHARPQRP